MPQMPSQILYALLSTAALIILDAIAGCLLAWRRGAWDWRKLPQFLRTNLAPYLGGLALLAALALLRPETTALFLTSTAATDLKFSLELLAKVRDLGIPVQQPDQRQSS